MKLVTILRVEPAIASAGKSWVVKRCDDDPAVVGEIVACGVPRRAADLPVGSTFKTVLDIK